MEPNEERAVLEAINLPIVKEQRSSKGAVEAALNHILKDAIVKVETSAPGEVLIHHCKKSSTRTKEVAFQTVLHSVLPAGVDKVKYNEIDKKELEARK